MSLPSLRKAGCWTAANFGRPTWKVHNAMAGGCPSVHGLTSEALALRSPTNSNPNASAQKAITMATTWDILTGERIID